MTDLLHISRKSDKQFLFEVQLNWLEENLGVLQSADVNGQLHVAIPEKFGGKGNEWSAEHLLLSALCSCFMSTYLAFAKKMFFEISHFECNAIGQIQLVGGIYKFTHINLYPKVFIVDPSLKSKAAIALKKTEKNCLVANSLNTDIIYHSEVITDEQNVQWSGSTMRKTIV